MYGSRFSKVFIAVTLGAALTMMLASVAAAQTATPTLYSALEDATVQVQVWPEAEPDGTVLIVGAFLPTSTPLPTMIDLPLPAGATVTWAGEVEGGDPANDISRDWEIVEGTGGSMVRFLVEQYYSVQFEAALPPVSIEGNRIVSRLDWVQTVSAKDMSLAWRVPAGTDDVVLDPDAPGTPLTNEVGERLYTLQSVPLDPGEEMSFRASYTRAGLETETTGSGFNVLTALWILLGIAAVALGMTIVRQRQLAAQAAEEDQ